jgi:DNA-binding NarL/FixJ family response regulator
MAVPSTIAPSSFRLGLFVPQPTLRQRLSARFRQLPGIDVVAEGTTPTDMQQLLATTPLDLLVWSIERQQEVDATVLAQLCSQQPDLPIIVMMQQHQVGLLRRLYLLQIRACVSDGITDAELLNSVRLVIENPNFFFVVSPARTG